MSNLRFIERDGKKILQERVAYHTRNPLDTVNLYHWVDVPLVDDEYVGNHEIKDFDSNAQIKAYYHLKKMLEKIKPKIIYWAPTIDDLNADDYYVLEDE